jgi:hypothetical protein
MDCSLTNWDGINDGGDLVASGVYIYHLSIEGWQKANKILLMR